VWAKRQTLSTGKHVGAARALRTERVGLLPVAGLALLGVAYGMRRRRAA
jgi:hypothetical protein